MADRSRSYLREPSRQPGRFRRAFMDRVGELAEFHGENGRYPDPAEGSLGAWVYTVRNHWVSYPADTRSDWKVDALEALPEWSWDGYRQSQRMPMMQRLTDWYLSVDGIFDPASSIPEQKQMARWIISNRDRFLSGSMESSRVQELESVPFWTWEQKNMSVDHKRSLIERELCWVIDHSTDAKTRTGGVTGFSGVRHQCDIVLSDHKIIIEHDGFTWHENREAEDADKTVDLENAGWTVIRIREAPLAHVGGVSVFAWHHPSVKELFEVTRVALEELGVAIQTVDTEALGKVPGTRTPYYDDWYSSFEALQTYIAEGGTSTPIATQMTGEFKVGQWVYVQRRSLKRGSLTDRKKELLESIPGWQWELKPQVKLGWDATYERLIEYQREHGSMPSAKFAYSDGLKLGSWAAYQRYTYRKGELTSDRVKRLEAVPGWYWEK